MVGLRIKYGHEMQARIQQKCNAIPKYIPFLRSIVADVKAPVAEPKDRLSGVVAKLQALRTPVKPRNKFALPPEASRLNTGSWVNALHSS